MCTAHAAGARVVLDGRGANSPSVYANATARAAWIAGRVRYALERHLDGINFDLVGVLLTRLWWVGGQSYLGPSLPSRRCQSAGANSFQAAQSAWRPCFG